MAIPPLLGAGLASSQGSLPSAIIGEVRAPGKRLITEAGLVDTGEDHPGGGVNGRMISRSVVMGNAMLAC